MSIPDGNEVEEGPPKKTLIVFGTDLAAIPCFRESFLYGVGSGTAFSLASFMFTSNGQRSAKQGLVVYAAVTFGYWIHCRYRYFQAKYTYHQLQSAMKPRDGAEMKELHEIEKELKSA